MIALPPIPKDELAKLTPAMRRWVVAVNEAFAQASVLTDVQNANGTLADVNTKLNALLAQARARVTL